MGSARHGLSKTGDQMRSSPKIYLAGPEVFLPNALEVGAAKVEICKSAGLIGVFPLDQSLDIDHLPPQHQAEAIALANEGLIRQADAMIANLTPFRGVSMDAGTAYEVGFMRALGRPVFGYSNSAEDYQSRTLRFRRTIGAWHDGDCSATEIEDFGLAENLMIDCGMTLSGLSPVRSPGDEPGIGGLEAFKVCVAKVASILLEPRAS